MCGLFGALRLPIADTTAVLAALAGRGPDDQGCFDDGVCTLLHTRLAIQDLSHQGHQPMALAEHQIVFNGEIYNQLELRQELERQGCVFSSSSDTEVILQGFLHWGDQLWPRLEGLFAVVIWNQRSQALTLARDRFGVKPLLWCRHEGGCLVASELCALRAAGLRTAIEPEALSGYALWGAYASPQTAVAGVESFPPGHQARCEADGSWTLTAFASTPPLPVPTAATTPEQAVEDIRRLLFNAVERQRIGDVPVGVFLSGGLDSGVLASLLKELTPGVVRSVSVGFTGLEGAVDESDRALASSRFIGTEHLPIRLGPADLEACFDEFVDAIDQPSIDGFNTFFVAKAASGAGLKVAFSGLGADEVFGGYAQFQQWQQAQQPGPVHAGRWPVQLLRLFGAESHAYRRRGLEAALDLRQIACSGVPAQQRAVLRQQRLACLPPGLSAWAALSELELSGYMRDTLLRDTDAVSMHTGLEVRVPYLDSALVTYCQSLPGSWHLKNGGKTLLKAACGDRLPVEVISGAKTGFNLPLGPWILAHARFSPLRIAALLRPIGISRRAIAASWGLLRADRRRWQPFWRWVVLAEWVSRRNP